MTEASNLMPPKKGIAYYHLPGLFEFYDLYCVFQPLYRKHREYFYDWCEIGSLYGAPADCIWGGGRIGPQDSSLFAEYHPVRTNPAYCPDRLLP